MPAEAAMVPVAYRVSGRRRETADTCTLELEPAGGERLAPFAPGQFAMLYAFGVGEVPMSISGGLGGERPLVHTVRAVGAATAAICAARDGEVLGVRGPFGSAWPLREAEGADVIVVAGGVGLAPLRPAVEQLIGRRERYGRVTVLYGGRCPEELLFRRELERWRARPDVELEVSVDAATADWRGRVGVVTKLIDGARFDAASTVAMICGPEVMMRFTAAALLERGVAPAAIHVSLERSMKCAIGLCGRCQLGPMFVCKDGPVFGWDVAEPLLRVRER